MFSQSQAQDLNIMKRKGNSSAAPVRQRKTKTSRPQLEEKSDEGAVKATRSAITNHKVVLVLLATLLVVVAVVWTLSSTEHGSRSSGSSMEGCTPINEQVVERRSNLSLDEFVRCYDGKRFGIFLITVDYETLLRYS